MRLEGHKKAKKLLTKAGLSGIQPKNSGIVATSPIVFMSYFDTQKDDIEP